MLLNSYEHAHLHYMPIDNHCFACQQPSLAVLASDIEALEGSDVPIILPRNLDILPRDLDALPLALLDASPQDDPLNGRTPALWENMPFSLTTPLVSFGVTGDTDSRVALQADPNAPHWSPDTGHRLFTPMGLPSAFLQQVMARLQQEQVMIRHTCALIDLLHDVGALTPAMAICQGKPLAVYHIEMDGLAARLDATESHLSLSAYQLAWLVVQSQASPTLTHYDMDEWNRLLECTDSGF